mgnify:CR=1 FL=1
MYLVVVYKVEWEDKDLNTYLYFYDCGHKLCSSSNKQDVYYNRVLCENDECPHISNIIGDNLILTKSDNSWIYNYISDEIVNNTYINYRHIGNNLFIVTDNTDSQGIIDLSGKEIVSPKYEYLDDYKDGFISYRNNNLYGIDTIDDRYQVPNKYEDIVLINDKIFAGRKQNLYHLYSYNKYYKLIKFLLLFLLLQLQSFLLLN